MKGKPQWGLESGRPLHPLDTPFWCSSSVQCHPFVGTHPRLGRPLSHPAGQCCQQHALADMMLPIMHDTVVCMTPRAERSRPIMHGTGVCMTPQPGTRPPMMHGPQVCMAHLSPPHSHCPCLWLPSKNRTLPLVTKQEQNLASGYQARTDGGTCAKNLYNAACSSLVGSWATGSTPCSCHNGCRR